MSATPLRPEVRAVAKIRFGAGNHGDFYHVLKARVADHFTGTGQNRFADRRLAVKGTLFALAALTAYGLILSDRFGLWGSFALANLYGLSALLLAINVAHDAAHHALTPYRRLNVAIQTAVFTLVGADAYLWRLRHVKSHHTFPNVNGCDIDIDSNAFLRLSPNHPRRWYHRWQHLYAPVVFWLIDVHTVFYQDFAYLLRRDLANMRDIQHPPHVYAMFVLCKLAYLTIVLIVPVAMLSLPWWQVALGALFMSFVSSVAFVLLLIGTHFSEETEFPEVGRQGVLPYDWAVHAMATSLDWSPTSGWATWLAGGANAHAAHHLFPTVSHVHYAAITRIVAATAVEFGVPYHATTLPRMIRSHFRFLRRMGHAPAPASAV